MPPVFSLTAAQREEFAVKLLAWFAVSMRPLPWRGAYDPYSVWVSEIMLQQTQMERGVRYFRRWMRLFPDIAAVAAAEEERVLKAWEGLGYYSRARNLHAAAKLIMDEHGSRFPRSLDAIRSLPGVGEYTAGAIASIAFNDPVPAVDANVIRIFSRICDIDVPATRPGVKTFITDAVRVLMPEDSPRLFTQALMELGALVCGKTPQCGACPLEGYCEARRIGTEDKRPVKAAKKAYAAIDASIAVIVRNGRLFIQKRPPYGLWGGLWELPGGCLEAGERPEQAVVREVLEETEMSVTVREKIAVVKHSYTTCRVTAHGFFCDLAEGSSEPVLHAATESKWIRPEEAARYAFPAGERKLLELLGWTGKAGGER